MQREVDRQFELLQKNKKERDGAREEADDAQRGAVTMFNEQKSHESPIDLMQSEVHRANNAVDKMSEEVIYGARTMICGRKGEPEAATRFIYCRG
jgi:hypothetical protein